MDALGGDGGMGVPGMMDAGMGGDPMMGDPNAMGGDPNAMGGDPNMQGDPNMMGGDMEGFDPGVEADPVNEPEKYIQQLSGKLSQELSKYTNEKGPNADLAKYVIGMVDAQAVKSLTDDDKKEVLNKIEKGETPDENGSEGLGESILTAKLLEATQLKEIINNILSPDEYATDREEREIRNPYLKKKNSPFVANR